MFGEGGPPMRERNLAPSRFLIYLVVSLVAVAYLVPLIVVVLNSLRSNEEIVQTSMIGWPRQWAFGNYLTAWSDFCVAQTCVGLRPYMLNSALVTIPATIFSTLLGAVAGYAVSLWRFRGINGSTVSSRWASSCRSRCACCRGPSCCAIRAS